MVRRLAIALATLLPRGLAWAAAVDPPLTVQTYNVRYSDADAFHWHPDLIRPVAAADDRLEARVTYETDEYGFRNPAPLPSQVDAVVLGRSISLAGHLDEPWPALLASSLGWQVFDLSWTGKPWKPAGIGRTTAPRTSLSFGTAGTCP